MQSSLNEVSFAEVMRRRNASTWASRPGEKIGAPNGPFAGTISAIAAREPWRRAILGAQLGPGDGPNHRTEPTGRERRDKARDHVAVMLHLRVRYVSKAAILTVPAPLVPAENRSPA
jgi:hypothetical protein